MAFEGRYEGLRVSWVSARLCPKTFICGFRLFWSNRLLADSSSLITRWKKVPAAPAIDTSSEVAGLDTNGCEVATVAPCNHFRLSEISAHQIPCPGGESDKGCTRHSDQTQINVSAIEKNHQELSFLPSISVSAPTMELKDR